jgi:hypothetical protein
MVYRAFSNNRTFNYFVSRVRVRSEHAVGYLKGWFGSLRGLRQQIRDNRFPELSLEWIKTCIVVHMLWFCIERDLPDGGMVEQLLSEGREDEDAQADENWGDSGKQLTSKKRKGCKERRHHREPIPDGE